ncbi:hypothetical protein [Alteraurantiacibacter aquimixticola]|uniref:Uncharacterized protein n=1 Tax=Alteraurantiacibacter aquimixticola TaxID=2489173 RepID=A0A4T3F1D3_9SPHN|nr:hypothetical protein [Alteraurantiacibacter aquimixticola]TIX49747.1 hypothetical protein E5222_13115 [Alteraurantiacibacter aquimixticola]
MGVKIRILASTGAVALTFQAGPAAAQYMPHLDPNLYMLTVMQMNSGSCGPMSDDEIDEARLPAPGIMQAYFDAAQSGASISHMFKLNGKTNWTLGDHSVGEDELDMQVDPLAVAGNSLDTETLRFFRAGNHQTALGQWLVTNPADEVAGVYTGQFTRERGEWRLHKLQIFRADDPVEPIKHYCSEPGDLNEATLRVAEASVDETERQVERAVRRYERDESRAVEAEARAAEKPDSSGRARRASERRQLANERLEELEEARLRLTEAQSELEVAQAEQAEFAALTISASGAREFRLLDDDGKRIEENAGQ